MPNSKEENDALSFNKRRDALLGVLPSVISNPNDSALAIRQHYAPKSLGYLEAASVLAFKTKFAASNALTFYTLYEDRAYYMEERDKFLSILDGQLLSNEQGQSSFFVEFLADKKTQEFIKANLAKLSVFIQTTVPELLSDWFYINQEDFYDVQSKAFIEWIEKGENTPMPSNLIALLLKDQILTQGIDEESDKLEALSLSANLFRLNPPPKITKQSVEYIYKAQAEDLRLLLKAKDPKLEKASFILKMTRDKRLLDFMQKNQDVLSKKVGAVPKFFLDIKVESLFDRAIIQDLLKDLQSQSLNDQHLRECFAKPIAEFLTRVFTEYGPFISSIKTNILEAKIKGRSDTDPTFIRTLIGPSVAQSHVAEAPYKALLEQIKQLSLILPSLSKLLQKYPLEERASKVVLPQANKEASTVSQRSVSAEKNFPSEQSQENQSVEDVCKEVMEEMIKKVEKDMPPSTFMKKLKEEPQQETVRQVSDLKAPSGWVDPDVDSDSEEDFVDPFKLDSKESTEKTVEILETLEHLDTKAAAQNSDSDSSDEGSDFPEDIFHNVNLNSPVPDISQNTQPVKAAESNALVGKLKTALKNVIESIISFFKKVWDSLRGKKREELSRASEASSNRVKPETTVEGSVHMKSSIEANKAEPKDVSASLKTGILSSKKSSLK